MGTSSAVSQFAFLEVNLVSYCMPMSEPRKFEVSSMLPGGEEASSSPPPLAARWPQLVKRKTLRHKLIPLNSINVHNPRRVITTPKKKVGRQLKPIYKERFSR